MISLTAAETATAWATLAGLALQTTDTAADCFHLIVGSTVHKGSAAGYGSAYPTVDCSKVSVWPTTIGEYVSTTGLTQSYTAAGYTGFSCTDCCAQYTVSVELMVSEYFASAATRHAAPSTRASSD